MFTAHVNARSIKQFKQRSLFLGIISLWLFTANEAPTTIMIVATNSIHPQVVFKSTNGYIEYAESARL